MTQTFSYLMIGSFDALHCVLDSLWDYLRFKVIAESDDWIFLEESNEIVLEQTSLEEFSFSVMEGYYGTTLAFRSKIVYDLYRVYQDGNFIAETEDPILNLPYRLTKKQQKTLKIEGFLKKDGDYLLSAYSSYLLLVPERVKRTDYLLSVIVPVYNAQIFLPRTVDSILSSSLSDLEVILVNDGSTDESLKICKWYAKHYPCVSVITQQNQKVAIARNTGIKAALGEFVAFVDNDDIVHPLMYEKLYNTCQMKHTDIVIAPTIIRNDIGEKEILLTCPGKKEDIVLYSYEEMMKNKWSKDNIFFVAVWNKIVRTSLVKQVPLFPEDYPNDIVLYEDSAYTSTLYSYLEKFALCKEAYYIRDKRKQKTLWTLSTLHKTECADDVWKSFIYAYSYPLYHRSSHYSELSDYSNFKRLIESYDKFKNPSPLWYYRNEELTKLINSQKLYENSLIMADNHLADVVRKLQ